MKSGSGALGSLGGDGSQERVSWFFFNCFQYIIQMYSNLVKHVYVLLHVPEFYLKSQVCNLVSRIFISACDNNG